jgi:transposase
VIPFPSAIGEGTDMMGRRNKGQGQLFYEFCLDEAVPDDHLVRQIGALLNLSRVYAELAPYCSTIGRPSIDPVLMIRMLIIGYVFAIRSRSQASGGRSRSIRRRLAAR